MDTGARDLFRVRPQREGDQAYTNAHVRALFWILALASGPEGLLLGQALRGGRYSRNSPTGFGCPRESIALDEHGCDLNMRKFDGFGGDAVTADTR